MTRRTIGKFALAPALLAGAVALALTSSGCFIDTGPGYGGSCTPELDVAWQIQNSAGTPVTCASAGAGTVTATIYGYGYPTSGTPYPQSCLPSETSDVIPIFLPATGNYSVTVALYASDGTTQLAPAQSDSFDVETCGVYPTTPAPLVVSTASQ